MRVPSASGRAGKMNCDYLLDGVRLADTRGVSIILLAVNFVTSSLASRSQPLKSRFKVLYRVTYCTNVAEIVFQPHVLI